MLTKLPILTCLLFATLYPLSFWISAKNPLKQNFHHFHLGVATVVAGLTVFGFIILNFPLAFQQGGLLWLGLLLFITFMYWKRETVNPWVLTIPSLIGSGIIWQLEQMWLGPNFLIFLTTVLGGMIFCAALFAMNLGHWYLNVHGLPLAHLRQATYVFWGWLLVRAWVDGYLIFNQKILYDGDVISIFQFMWQLDGFFLWIALFFGTLFPLAALYFAKGTLDAKNTQATTGILYAILCSVIIGDLTYKYYLLKFGITL